VEQSSICYAVVMKDRMPYKPFIQFLRGQMDVSLYDYCQSNKGRDLQKYPKIFRKSAVSSPVTILCDLSYSYRNCVLTLSYDDPKISLLYDKRLMQFLLGQMDVSL